MQSKKKLAIRVGFIFYEVNWLGGVNYLRNLFSVISIMPNINIQPVLFAGLKADVSEFEGLAEIVQTPMLDRNHLLWWLSKFLTRVFPKKDYLLFLLLRQKRIDLLSHFGRLWKGCSIPAVGWIPDFQHKHFPKLFTKKECVKLDKLFSDIINKSDALIVSSQTAFDDLNRFCNGNIPETHILRFVACLYSYPKNYPKKTDLEAKYNIYRPWFYIPNQFWSHKNHTVLLEALHLNKKQGNCPLVIATGSTTDHRNPDLYASITEKIHKYGLEDDFLILGIVPYADVVALMRYSIAVFNPSLFEGWSTSVEEAKAMGKKLILSDIAVHFEQNPLRAVYFDPHNYQELAKQITIAIKSYVKEDEEKYFVQAQKMQIKKIQNFAQEYSSILFKVNTQKI